MFSQEIIKEILEIAVNAPSGENAQPWKFGIRENLIFVFNIPERDQSPYNFRQRASYVAHGTLIENIVIISSALGFAAKISLFPDQKNSDLVATISLEKSQPKEEPLYPYIIQRVTNRKPFKNTAIKPEDIKELLKVTDGHKGSRIVISENPQDIKALGLVGSMNERLVFENETLHNFLFSHLNWTDEENKEKKIGFDIKTLELPPPAQAAFKIFKHWKAVKVLSKVGLSKAIWKQNGAIYSSSSAIGIVAVPGNTNQDFVLAGRLTQRVWLTATKLKISFQPMTGILFFMQRILASNSEPFTPPQVELIKESFEKVREIFKVQQETVPMMFRLGYGDPPTAQSLKLAPIIEFE